MNTIKTNNQKWIFQDFKLYFQLLRAQKSMLLVYLLITALLFGILAYQATTSLQKMRANQVGAAMPTETIGVIDHDQSPLSKALLAYIGKNAKLQPLTAEADIQNNIFARRIDGAIILPKGLSADLFAGRDVPVKTISGSDSYLLKQVWGQVNFFFKVLRMEQVSYGLDPTSPDKALATAPKWDAKRQDEEIGRVSQLLQSKIQLKNRTIGFDVRELFAKLLDMTDYVLLAMLFYMVGNPLLRITELKIKRRLSLGLQRESARLLTLMGAILLAATVLWLFFMGISYAIIAIFDGPFPSPMLFLIGFVHLLAMIGLVLFLCQLVSKREAVGAYGALIPVIVGFTCGIFVDRELLSHSVQEVGKFIPAYWAVSARSAWAAGPDSYAQCWQAIAIMGAMAVVFFLLTLAWRRARLQS